MKPTGAKRMNGFILNIEDKVGIIESRLNEAVTEIKRLKRTQEGLRQEVKLLNEALESRGVAVYGRC